MTDASNSTRPESGIQGKQFSFREAFKKAASNIFDTEVLFAVGDFVYAYLTAEPVGIALNGIAAAIAVGGRLYESFTGSKPLGLGFYSMAAVSAVTAGSVLLNDHDKYVSDMFNVMSAGPRELLFSFAANTFWAAANGLAGYWKSKGTPASGPAVNHQTYFCLGSIAATNAKLAPLLILAGALAKSLSKGKTDGSGKIETWKDFGREHLTPQRLRAVAYAISAATAVAVNPRYIVPYLLWMAGNFAFDNNGKNNTLKNDFKAVIAGSHQARALPKQRALVTAFQPAVN